MPNCTMCSQQVPNEFPMQSDVVVQPTGGLHLAIYTGYAMFTDPIEEQSFDALTKIRLCHDCSVKVIDLFPEDFKQKYFTSGHPVTICRTQSNTYPDGCHYAWA